MLVTMSEPAIATQFGEDILVHHPPGARAIVIAHGKVEGRLRHIIGVLVELLEVQLVVGPGLGVAEEPIVDNCAGIDRLCDGAVGERVAVNL